jgi:hypothetical protein
MKQIKEFIIEKLRINKDTKSENFFDFDIKGVYKFKARVFLPFTINLILKGESQKVYDIQLKTGPDNKPRWLLLDEDGNTITYLIKEHVKEMLDDNMKRWCSVYYLNGKKHGNMEMVQFENVKTKPL